MQNTALEKGGGVYCWAGVESTILNSIIVSNSAPSLPNWGGKSYIHCATEPAVDGASGYGNISEPPVFVDLSRGDLHLALGSPGIDAGENPNLITSPLAPKVVTFDKDGIPRPLDGDNDGVAKWDMGAYEFVHPSADTDCDTQSDADELIAGTIPVDSKSFFAVDHISETSDGDPIIGWYSVCGRLYSIYSKSQLVDPVWGTALYRRPGEGGMMTYTNTGGLSRKFFRIGVEKAP